MVSTRRSRSAGGESEQVIPAQGSQEDVSSKPSKHALEPITEEPQQQQPAPTPRGRRRVASQQQQQQHQKDPEPQQQEQHQPQPTQASKEGHEHQQLQDQQQQEHHAAQRVQQQQQQQRQQHVDDSSDDDDMDLDFDGEGVLQNLAAAIRSGFQSQSKKQQTQQQPQQQQSALQAAAAAAAAAGRSHGRELDDAELQQLRWRPQTGLSMPARAAAAVAITKPRAKKHTDEHAGALVSAPAAAEDAAAGSAEQLDPTAAAAASKQPGLSKALRAPTLDAAARTKEAKKSAPDTAGAKWFDLPAPKITDELKRDLRLLRLRGAYDPKRFYKSFDNTKFPKYFAVGTVVDDPLEQNNLSKGQRRATLTEQLLVDAELTNTRKRRFNKLQEDSQKWAKAKAKKRKTSQPRKNPSKHRPKH